MLYFPTSYFSVKMCYQVKALYHKGRGVGENVTVPSLLTHVHAQKWQFMTVIPTCLLQPSCKKRHILLKLAIKSALWKGRAELLRRNPGCWNVENELLWVEMSDDTVFFLFVVNFGPSWSMINNIMLSWITILQGCIYYLRYAFFEVTCDFLFFNKICIWNDGSGRRACIFYMPTGTILYWDLGGWSIT